MAAVIIVLLIIFVPSLFIILFAGAVEALAYILPFGVIGFIVFIVLALIVSSKQEKAFAEKMKNYLGEDRNEWRFYLKSRDKFRKGTTNESDAERLKRLGQEAAEFDLPSDPVEMEKAYYEGCNQIRQFQRKQLEEADKEIQFYLALKERHCSSINWKNDVAVQLADKYGIPYEKSDTIEKTSTKLQNAFASGSQKYKGLTPIGGKLII